MKNTAIEEFCDWGMVFSLCASVFVLPASIAFLDSFAALAIAFYLLKKIIRIAIDWPSKTLHLNILGKIHFAWRGFAPPANFLDRPLQFLALAFFISVLFSQYPTLSLYAFFGKFLKGVFLYFSFIEAFGNKQRIWIFLGFLFLAAFITALSAAIQHYSGKDFLKGHLVGGRISSLFSSANGFGAYLLPVIALVTHFLFTAMVRHKSWIRGSLWALFLVLLVACLCWTYSRSSWIGYLVILFVMVLMDRRKVLLAGALLAVFIFVFLPSLNNVRHMHLINDNDGAVQEEGSFYDVKSLLEQGGSGRFNFWKKAVSIIRSSPICGTGLNTYGRIIKRDPDTKTWWYAHNCYLQMTAETGLLGLVSFLWMVFVLFQHGINYFKQIKDLWILTLFQGTIAGLLSFLVQSFFDNTFYTVQLGMLMWLIFGLMVALTRLNPALESKA